MLHRLGGKKPTPYACRLITARSTRGRLQKDFWAPFGKNLHVTTEIIKDYSVNILVFGKNLANCNCKPYFESPLQALAEDTV
jgi:hypothetical protein